eukprot:1159619-Pelagomonas_calceolata.AAC.10
MDRKWVQMASLDVSRLVAVSKGVGLSGDIRALQPRGPGRALGPQAKPKNVGGQVWPAEHQASCLCGFRAHKGAFFTCGKSMSLAAPYSKEEDVLCSAKK